MPLVENDDIFDYLLAFTVAEHYIVCHSTEFHMHTMHAISYPLISIKFSYYALLNNTNNKTKMIKYNIEL